MTFDQTTAVSEVAIGMPNATRVFEKAGIDFCCGGAKSLAAACASAGVVTEEVINSINEASRQEAPDDAPQSLGEAPLTKVIAYIVDKHHVFTRQELARLDALFVKVCSVHGQNHRETHRVQEIFKAYSKTFSYTCRRKRWCCFLSSFGWKTPRRATSRRRRRCSGRCVTPSA